MAFLETKCPNQKKKMSSVLANSLLSSMRNKLKMNFSYSETPCTKYQCNFNTFYSKHIRKSINRSTSIGQQIQVWGKLYPPGIPYTRPHRA